MANWEEQVRYYRERGYPQQKAADDVIAGRILKGMGFTNPGKIIYPVEQALFGETNGTAPLIVRAITVWQHMLGQNADYRYLTARWHCSTTTVKKFADALGYMTAASMYVDGEWPLVFMRVNGTTACEAMTLWLPEELPMLRPPYRTWPCDDLPNYRITSQDIVEFVRQFGPYPIGGPGA